MDAQQVMASEDLSHTNIIKGKRTKRQRLPSPLGLPVTSSSSSGGDSGAEPLERIDSNMSSATTMTCPVTSIEFAESTGGEEEDMANCLILLAQGSSLHNQTRKLSEPAAMATSTTAVNKESGSWQLYQCKTCNRFFPSFQALGGHRTSHKKPHNKTNNEENRVIEEEEDQLLKNMSTALSLQMPNRALYGSSNIKSNKVHECSICGAEFSSGQALGGHMRRHRAAFATTSTTTTTTRMNMSLVTSSCESQESKKPRNSLELDLNLPAPEDDLQELNFHFGSKEQVLVFSASSLVDCHY
ncbi:hypothetical protein P3X46_009639 [Hevea brasiliensis]|uniref:C2H2-type domain-containing protein n=1 Tax=Hevea brasiliensis TaxID=3981 RepID=A0ABQ9MMM5_HEVBR|nr:zinc finger protein ZAT5 [Hevea brasiliensis]KAJ9181516.1 hypothetical protein P3X46_009639 [Hevea brasiliensis]